MGPNHHGDHCPHAPPSSIEVLTGESTTTVPEPARPGLESECRATPLQYRGQRVGLGGAATSAGLGQVSAWVTCLDEQSARPPRSGESCAAAGLAATGPWIEEIAAVISGGHHDRPGVCRPETTGVAGEGRGEHAAGDRLDTPRSSGEPAYRRGWGWNDTTPSATGFCPRGTWTSKNQVGLRGYPSR